MDFLADELAKQEVLQTSNKGFSFPGYTSSDVLPHFKFDDSMGKPDFNQEEIQAAMAKVGLNIQ